ncbi:MAG: hypothetical protein EZS28_001417 [Streblomastix strix]|uniref:Uncharacterized protein n=1 Tax=Streblomastix strix TaxID=222440 RepID=A0A5J4X974_9EUKA|nr:MAG: hypothetical protein EZS28_001417 [Streblomastix strix]
MGRMACVLRRAAHTYGQAMNKNAKENVKNFYMKSQYLFSVTQKVPGEEIQNIKHYLFLLDQNSLSNLKLEHQAIDIHHDRPSTFAISDLLYSRDSSEIFLQPWVGSKSFMRKEFKQEFTMQIIQIISLGRLLQYISNVDSSFPLYFETIHVAGSTSFSLLFIMSAEVIESCSNSIVDIYTIEFAVANQTPKIQI